MSVFNGIGEKRFLYVIEGTLLKVRYDPYPNLITYLITLMVRYKVHYKPSRGGLEVERSLHKKRYVIRYVLHLNNPIILYPNHKGRYKVR